MGGRGHLGVCSHWAPRGLADVLGSPPTPAAGPKGAVRLAGRRGWARLLLETPPQQGRCGRVQRTPRNPGVGGSAGHCHGGRVVWGLETSAGLEGRSEPSLGGAGSRLACPALRKAPQAKRRPLRGCGVGTGPGGSPGLPHFTAQPPPAHLSPSRPPSRQGPVLLEPALRGSRPGLVWSGPARVGPAPPPGSWGVLPPG